MKKIIFALLIFCAFACNSSDCIKLKLGKDTELQNGDLVCIDGEEYSFRVTDSRCGCWISCFWQGEFIFDFENSEGVNTYTYHQFQSEFNEIPSIADSFELVSDHPWCSSQNNIDDIIFTVRID